MISDAEPGTNDVGLLCSVYCMDVVCRSLLGFLGLARHPAAASFSIGPIQTEVSLCATLTMGAWRT
jgi:hypothetical protein